MNKIKRNPSFVNTFNLCVACGPYNKQRLSPQAALTSWSWHRRQCAYRKVVWMRTAVLSKPWQKLPLHPLSEDSRWAVQKCCVTLDCRLPPRCRRDLSLVSNVTQRWLVFIYWRFGITCRSFKVHAVQEEFCAANRAIRTRISMLQNFGLHDVVKFWEFPTYISCSSSY